MGYMHPSVLICLVLRIGSALGAAPAVPAPSPSSLLKARVSEVIDGDTVRVWLDGKEELVRYLAIEAPELSEAGGLESRQVHQKLLSSGQVWLECDPVAGEPLGRDGRRRLLAYAFAEQAAKRCLNTELVRLGAARVGIRSVNDDTPDDAFAVKRLDDLVAAQLEAAKSRAGWWGKGDPHAASDFLVCFIKFWGKDEAAWLLNRGASPVDLTTGWILADRDERNWVVLGQRVPTGKLQLPAGGVCRVHTGSGAKGTRVEDGTQAMDLLWTRARVWNNSGDTAILRSPEGAVVYTYVYEASGS